MDKLIRVVISLAIVLFSAGALAIEQDKNSHLQVSFLLGAALYSKFEKKHSKLDAYFLSVLTVMVLGGAKELFVDDKADVEDMKYNLMGAMAGPIIFIRF